MKQYAVLRLQALSFMMRDPPIHGIEEPTALQFPELIHIDSPHGLFIAEVAMQHIILLKEVGMLRMPTSHPNLDDIVAGDELLVYAALDRHKPCTDPVDGLPLRGQHGLDGVHLGHHPLSVDFGEDPPSHNVSHIGVLLHPYVNGAAEAVQEGDYGAADHFDVVVLPRKGVILELAH